MLAFLADEARTATAFTPAPDYRGRLRLRRLREGAAAARRRRRPRPDRPHRPRPGRRGPGPGLQVGRQGRRRRPGCWRSAASSSCSSTCSPRASSGGTSSPAASTGRSGGTATARPRACCERSSRRSWRASTRGPATTSTTRPSRRRSTPARAKAEEIVASIQGGDVGRDPIGGSCPTGAASSRSAAASAALPEDEPWSEDERGGVSAERTEQQSAAVESRERDVFLRAGAGTGKTTVLVERFCAAALDPEVGVEPHPRLHLHRAGGGPAAAADPRGALRARRGGRGRAARGAGGGARGDRARLDLDDPRLLPPGARLASRGGGHRSSLPGRGRGRGGAARRARLRLGARGSWSTGEPEALELAAANRRRTLLEMTRGAYDELRSHGDPRPDAPGARPPDTGAAIGRAGRGRARGPRRVRGGERPGGVEPRAHRRRHGAGPGGAARRGAPGAAPGPGDQVGRRRPSRARPASATRRR